MAVTLHKGRTPVHVTQRAVFSKFILFIGKQVGSTGVRQRRQRGQRGQDRDKKPLETDYCCWTKETKTNCHRDRLLESALRTT